MLNPTHAGTELDVEVEGGTGETSCAFRSPGQTSWTALDAPVSVVWDRCCMPIARRVDTMLAGHIGQSIFAVWRRDG